MAHVVRPPMIGTPHAQRMIMSSSSRTRQRRPSRRGYQGTAQLATALR
jgi:hypothetical protein